MFDHERLVVYQRSLDLVEAVDRYAVEFEGPRRHIGWQLHRAATSAVLNIAEANGRRTPDDRAHFIQIALGSALECAAAVDIAERLGVGSPTARERIRRLTAEVVKMLTALSRNTRERRPADPGRSYT